MVSIGGSIGKVGIVDRDCSCNQQINYITAFKVMLPRFIYWTLRSSHFQDQVMDQAPSTTLPILSKGKWDLLLTPLPPSNEQHRIIARIDELMSICDELETNLRHAETASEELVEAVVSEVVGVSDKEPDLTRRHARCRDGQQDPRQSLS